MTKMSPNQSVTRSTHSARWIFSVLTILVTLLGSVSPYAANTVLAQPVAAQVSVSTLHLTVQSANDSAAYGITKGDEITEFKYIINIDNTGTTDQRSPDLDTGCSPEDPNYPESCLWVSIAGRAPNSPIFTQGDQSDFPGGVFTIDGQAVELPEGRYLISVLADDHRIDGAHFSIPSDGSDVIVEMQPYDLPTATIQAAVFEDMTPTNSGPDLPAEHGLAGFRAHIVDYIDEVTVDIFGNPLGAEYYPNGDYIPGTGGVVLSKCYVVANGLDVGWVEPLDEMGRCPVDVDPAGMMYDINYPHTSIPVDATGVVEGKVIIPNVGPNRYALAVSPPNESNWIQTTTLEGNHDWDAWVMEGATGLDTEFVVGGEPFPATFFGFVRPSVNEFTDTEVTGSISGRGIAINAYIPPAGGMISGEGVRGGQPKDNDPIPNPIRRLFVSLSDLDAGDQTKFIQEFGCEINTTLDCAEPVEFNIPNVPDGSYVLGVWDEPQDYIFAVQNVIIQGGLVLNAVDAQGNPINSGGLTGNGTNNPNSIGDISLVGWWNILDGYVFYDDNGDGIRDPGEAGVPNYPVTLRMRENAAMDRGTVSVTTDNNGYYWMESAYPMTQWLIMEAYSDVLHTTGITYYTDNSDPITVVGAGVDVNVHPIISQTGHLDWGVQAYQPGENGGIVGTVSYDSTRNELDPAYAAIEDWQPSIADLNVELYAPVACGTNDGVPCDPTGLYELAQDGSYAFGSLLNTYLTETWEKPAGCVARDLAGNPLEYGFVDQHILPYNADGINNPGNQDQSKECIEAPLLGVQFGPLASDLGTPDEGFGATVDGNYGFGDGCFIDANTPGLFDPDTGECISGEIMALPSNRDYLVRVDIPDDVFGRPLYQVTREEDINVANGDSFVPQVPPSACAGALHTVDLNGDGTDGYLEVVGAGYDVNGLPVGVTVPASVPTDNAPFLDMGGTVYEGQQKPLCDTKLIHLGDQKSIAPGFNLFTDVPLPGRFWGLIVDDLNWSTNPQQLSYGEKAGVPFAPIGIYDYTNRLITTVESDYNGLFDVLVPSTNRISCPTPSGVCANMYRFVGNDPGTPNNWNANYNPLYRTISAEFEAFAGLTVPADLAPTQVGVTVQNPGQQTQTPVQCLVDPGTPQIFRVSDPYTDLRIPGAHGFIISGMDFGGTAGQVLLDGVALSAPTWSDTVITATVPTTNDLLPGPHQLTVETASGATTINGLTFHVLDNARVLDTNFPSANTSVLDNFNDRGSLGNSWGTTPNNAFTIRNNPGTANDYLQIRTSDNSFASARYNPNGAVFSANQEAYFTFRQIATSTFSNHQSLMLKWWNTSGGSSDPTGNSARWIEVAVNQQAGSVNIYAKTNNSPTPTSPATQASATIPGVTFGNGDVFGARALENGTVQVFKNGVMVGSANIPATAGWTGRIGIRFEGTGTGNSTTAGTLIDNFGGGDLTVAPAYTPTLFEVGPGHTYATIQGGIDAAASQSPYSDSLVVVYPGLVDETNPRYNGRGAYYENPIMYAPIKLQGVGPGGVRPDNSIVQGSIIDGLGFAGDTALAEAWLDKVASLTWSGNQDINDGQVIYVLASENGTANATTAGSFGSDFKAQIDGFDLRGGDQQGLPGNLAEVFGTLPDALGVIDIVTQGGAIFANSYARNLQVTNNVVESNGGSYGAIRIGTPNIGDQNNENLRIANNRILANGGTNLAGAIGLFNGADNYEIANNDLCGNFSAEYGGAISHFGLSNGGSIHDNRIYYNRSYDEGAGIMIAGELATDPLAAYGQPGGPQGSGAVSIFNNLIQANLSGDDGGGIRFLMVGDYLMNVYNNMIVNNVSAHEGGGVALDDASNVDFYNNTVMNNVTTATAITSNGLPAPAGLSMGVNSDALQLLVGEEFSDPNMFNNIFWDNRAGSPNPLVGAEPFVIGIGAAGAGDINNWDVGSMDGHDLDTLVTNNMFQVDNGLTPAAILLNTINTNPNVVDGNYHIPMTFTNWGAFVTNILVTIELPPSLMGDYHLAAGSPAIDPNPALTGAPATDYDGDARDLTPDIGADEYLP